MGAISFNQNFKANANTDLNNNTGNVQNVASNFNPQSSGG